MSIKDAKTGYFVMVVILLTGLFGLVLKYNAESEPQRVTIHLKMPAIEARKVELVGSFNHWQKQCCLMRDPDTGAWSIELNLAPGIYEYAFVVDGKIRVFDQSGGRLGDGLGGRNAVLYVNKLTFKKGGGNV